MANIKRDNLVLAEFFLANVHAHSLDDLMREMGERMRDGADIKFAVRFYDCTGRITSHVRRYALYSKRKHKILEKEKGGWRDRLQYRWVSFMCRRLQARSLPLAIAAFATALRSGAEAAVEDDYLGPLRRIKDAECHEFIEKVSRARHVWLIVFEPNDLLSDKNKILAVQVF